MDYRRIYDELISDRFKQKAQRKLDKKNGAYFERHHIVMRCKGGSNDESNIVLLTAREHFLAHWMLWRIYRDRQSSLAFHKMLSKNKLGQYRYYSSIGYDEARISFSETNKGNKFGLKKESNKPHRMTCKHQREAHSIAMKGMFSGEKNPFYGKKHSEDVRKIMSKKAKERYKNEIPYNSKLVLNIESGIYYYSCKEASESKCINYSTFRTAMRKNDGVYNSFICV